MTSTCFGKTRDHLQGGRIHRMSTLKIRPIIELLNYQNQYTDKITVTNI